MTPSKALSIARTAIVFRANIARVDDGMLQEDVLAFKRQGHRSIIRLKSVESHRYKLPVRFWDYCVWRLVSYQGTLARSKSGIPHFPISSLFCLHRVWHPLLCSDKVNPSLIIERYTGDRLNGRMYQMIISPGYWEQNFKIGRNAVCIENTSNQSPMHLRPARRPVTYERPEIVGKLDFVDTEVTETLSDILMAADRDIDAASVA